MHQVHPTYNRKNTLPLNIYKINHWVTKLHNGHIPINVYIECEQTFPPNDTMVKLMQLFTSNVTTLKSTRKYLKCNLT